jgi:hypothetical protein
METTLLSEMYSVSSKTGTERIQFFLHCSRNRTETGQAVGQPEPPQLLHTDQRCFQNFSEVKTLIQNLAGKAIIPHVGGMAAFPTAPSEHVAREGGHNDGQKKCTQDEERFNQAYQLTNPSVGNHVNVTKKMITPTHAVSLLHSSFLSKEAASATRR